MTYLIFLVVMLAIVAPIFAILPSARQRQQMAMRKSAMAAGFSIELTRIEDPDPDREKYLSNTGKPLERILSCIAYRYPRKRASDWRRLPTVDYELVRRNGVPGTGLPGEWAWVPACPAEMSDELEAYFLNNLMKLPDDVVRVEEVKTIFSVYWNEHGGDSAVSAIIAFAKGCMEISPFDPDLLEPANEP